MIQFSNLEKFSDTKKWKSNAPKAEETPEELAERDVIEAVSALRDDFSKQVKELLEMLDKAKN